MQRPNPQRSLKLPIMFIDLQCIKHLSFCRRAFSSLSYGPPISRKCRLGLKLKKDLVYYVTAWGNCQMFCSCNKIDFTYLTQVWVCLPKYTLWKASVQKGQSKTKLKEGYYNWGRLLLWEEVSLYILRTGPGLEPWPQPFCNLPKIPNKSSYPSNHHSWYILRSNNVGQPRRERVWGGPEVQDEDGHVPHELPLHRMLWLLCDDECNGQPSRCQEIIRRWGQALHRWTSRWVNGIIKTSMSKTLLNMN